METIHHADRSVLDTVASEVSGITEVVDHVVRRLGGGFRLFYIGAGASGRLGVLDASECPPTFSVDAELVQALIAGGDRALRTAVEGAEDDPGAAEQDLRGRELSESDVLIGIAASGRTPYVIGGLRNAHALGAMTAAINCVPDSAIARVAHFVITPIVGPEVITGSTRMKAGTATKLVLNMISTRP